MNIDKEMKIFSMARNASDVSERELRKHDVTKEG